MGIDGDVELRHYIDQIALMMGKHNNMLCGNLMPRVRVNKTVISLNFHQQLLSHTG